MISEIPDLQQPGWSNLTSPLNYAPTDVAQPPIQPPSGVANTPNSTIDNIFYIGPYTFFLIIGVVFLIMTRLLQVYHVKRRRRRQRRQARERLSALSNSELLYNGLGPVHLEMEDRIKLYERTLDRNQQSHILTEDNFEPSEEDANEDIELGGDQEFYYDDDEESHWIYLNLRAKNTSSNGDDEDKDQSDNDKNPEQNHDAVDTSCNNDNAEPAPRTKVSGTCIICFDDFQVGEKIVFSENHSQCKHVFHEDCMAQFLASNSMRKKPLNSSNGGLEHIPTTSYSENPCPTCRQPFCQVSQEEIVVSVLLKSVKAALLESALNTENNGSTEVDEENPNNEDLNTVNTENEINQDEDDDEDDGQIQQSIHTLQSNDNHDNLPHEDV